MNPPEPATAKVPAPPSAMAQLRAASSGELIFRIIIGVVILGSLGLAWWSYTKVLPPLQARGKDLASTLSGLNTEVDDLQRKWSLDAERGVTNQYAQVRSQLFATEAAFDRWMANLNGQASTLTLDAKADFGKTSPVSAPGEKLATIPASIFVEVRSPLSGIAAQSPYNRIVQLTQQLCTQEKRADLAAVSVSGGIGSISRAVVVLNLWAGEEKTE